MKINERNAGRRKIKDRQVVTVFVSGLENKKLIKETAKSLQILEPKKKKMFDLLFIATVVATFLFLSVVIIKNDRKHRYELRYINGWFVIQHSKSQEVIKRFRSQEQAEIWFNENCKEL